MISPARAHLYRHLKHRHFSLSACQWRRKPKPVRDMSKRNLQGEELKEHMRKREESMKKQEPYKLALADVINRFKMEIEENERRKHDMQGELMRRELAEREQAAKNLTIIAKSNEELRRQRELQKLIDEDEVKRREEERLLQKQILKEEIKERNTKLVLRIIEESKDFVTAENLEENLTAALEKEINFNYAITSEGKKIHSTKPPGNLDDWKGASPSAYIMGGIKPGSGQWNIIFQGRDGDKQSRKES